MSEQKTDNLLPCVNDAIENYYKDKPDAAPRVTKAQIEESISVVHYFTAAQGIEAAEGVEVSNPKLKTFMFCMIVLKNGWIEHGFNAIVSPDNHNLQLARELSYKMAFDKLWGPVAYYLCETLHQKKAA